MKTIKIKINGNETTCKIVEKFNNGDIRISYPTYYNGIYNGCEEMTIKRGTEKWFILF